MAENNDLKSVTGFEKLTDRVQNWLDQAGLKSTDVSNPVRKRMIQADMYLTEKEAQLKTAIKEYTDVNFSITNFCEEIGITKPALYKKSKSTGATPYKIVIDNLSTEISAVQDKCSKAARRAIIKDNDMHETIKTSLLLKEAEYQDQKIQLSRKDDEIKSLKEENLRLKKLIKTLRNAN